MGRGKAVTPQLTFGEFERRGWEEVAGSYEQATKDLAIQAVEPLLDGVGAGEGMVVLDVPTGPGYIIGAGAARGASVIGVDISQAMLKVAASNNPGADLRHGAAEELPVEDGTVDAVVSAYGMPHFVDHGRFFREAHRVLRPGGRLAFATFCPPPANQHIGLVFATLNRVANLDVGLPPGPDVFRFSDAGVCEEELEAAGFRGVHVSEIPVEWRSAEGADDLIRQVQNATVRSRALLNAQTDAVMAAVRAGLAEGLEPFRGSDGMFRVPATSVLVTASRP